MTQNIIRNVDLLFEDKKTCLAFIEKQEKFSPGYFEGDIETLKEQLNDLEDLAPRDCAYDEAIVTKYKWLVSLTYKNQVLYFKDRETPYYIAKDVYVDRRQVALETD